MKITYLSFILILISCTNKNVIENKQKNKKEIKQEELIEGFDLSKPALYMGTSFGEYIQGLYILGEFDKIISLISSKDKREFTNEELKELLVKNNFSYKIKLKRVEPIDSNAYILHYTSSEFATKNVKRLNLVLENDSLKVRFYKEGNKYKVFY